MGLQYPVLVFAALGSLADRPLCWVNFLLPVRSVSLVGAIVPSKGLGQRETLPTTGVLRFPDDSVEAVAFTPSLCPYTYIYMRMHQVCTVLTVTRRGSECSGIGVTDSCE